MAESKIPKPEKTPEAFLTEQERKLTRRDMLSTSVKALAIAAGAAMLPRQA